MYAVDFSLTNGLGKPSISIYFSGCDISKKCEGCHNPELWSHQESKVSYKSLKEVIESSKNFTKELIVSFVGGEPLSIINREKTKAISSKLKKDYPEIQTILYSWRMPNEIEEEWIENIDYGVLGRFEKDKLRENYLPGSSNQIIYNFKEKRTLKPIYLEKGEK